MKESGSYSKKTFLEKIVKKTFLEKIFQFYRISHLYVSNDNPHIKKVRNSKRKVEESKKVKTDLHGQRMNEEVCVHVCKWIQIKPDVHHFSFHVWAIHFQHNLN